MFRELLEFSTSIIQRKWEKWSVLLEVGQDCVSINFYSGKSLNYSTGERFFTYGIIF